MTDLSMRPAVDVGPRIHTPSPSTASVPNRALLLAGPLVLLLYVAVMALAGEAPDSAADPAQVVSYWSDVPVAAPFLVSGVAFALGAFGAGLAGVLRAHGDRGALPTLVGVGAAVGAAGLTVEAAVALTLVDVAGDIDPVAVQSLHAVMDNFFMPVVAGFGLLLAGAGFSARRTGALPAPLAWAGIVLGVIAPFHLAGFATYTLGGLWIAVAGVVLARGARA
jgi:hypothetical protein